jgi:hypothetical protein
VNLLILARNLLFRRRYARGGVVRPVQYAEDDIPMIMSRGYGRCTHDRCDWAYVGGTATEYVNALARHRELEHGTGSAK